MRKAKRFLLIFLVVLTLVMTIPSLRSLGDLFGDLGSQSSGSGDGGSSDTFVPPEGVELPAELVF